MISGFFILINLIEGKDFQHGIQDLKQKFVPTMIINWKMWIPANFVNFYLMPIKYQVFFANIVSIFFNTALSFIHNNNDDISLQKAEH